mgnify:CR=1 FL=1
MTEEKNLINSNEDPIVLFGKWFEVAKQKEVNNSNAMNLSTVSKNSKPSSRIVLLKSFDEKGFVFYTNTKSPKGNSIASNPYVALNFYWKNLLRQIKIEGIATQISIEESDTYFNSRPKASKISAWASHQSSELKSREELEKKVEEYTHKFKNKTIPRPPYWGGYKVEPLLMEFWQEMPFRLHDRVEFKKNKEGWSNRKLYP